MSNVLHSTPKRNRARIRRTRTGCLTCRTRRIKCGEEWPCCLKCSDSGRTCDGSPDKDNSIALSLGTSAIKSAKELRYFDYYRHRTTPDLSGYDTQSYFWNCMVLQTSHAFPAVLHAALALGALHEHMDGKSAYASKDKTHRFLLQQVNKSIRSLCSQKITSPIQVTLICCILFISLENAQGDHESALRHLQGGLNILEGLRLQEKGLGITSQEQEIFTHMFSRLDFQATTFYDSRQPRLYANASDGFELDLHSSSSFENLYDAQVALESIEIRLLYILTSNAEAVTRVLLLQVVEQRFIRWLDTFEALLTRETQNMQRQDLQRAVLLKLHQKTMFLMLKMKSDPVEIQSTLLDPQIESEFSSVLGIARSLINATSAHFSSTFTAETGIVAPLYFVAMNSRSRNTKKEAIKLLSRCKRREGFWYPELAVKIADSASENASAEIPCAGFTGGIPDLEKAYGVNT